MVISEEGLLVAHNLLKVARHSDDEPAEDTIIRASNACALGMVEELLMSNGDRVRTAPFNERTKRLRLDKDAGQGGATDSTVGEGTIGEEEALCIDRVVVQWWGNPEAGPGTVNCKLTGVMRALDVRDEVPRSAIFYQEPEPGKIRMRQNGLLWVTSLDGIAKSAPPAVNLSLGRTDNGCQVGKAASGGGVGKTNHAGFYIDNQPPMPHEELCWQTTLKEVKGFVWKGLSNVTDGDPPTYQVVDIRRWNGTLWGIVDTSNGDRQEDHMLDTIRKMIFDARVASVSRRKGFVGKTPLMLSWSSFQNSSLALDFDLIAANLDHYLTNMVTARRGSRWVA